MTERKCSIYAQHLISNWEASFASAFSLCRQQLGLVGLTRSLAVEVGKCGIRVNAQSPSAVEAERTNQALAGQARATNMSFEAVREEFLVFAPMARMITADEVAVAVVVLRNLSGVTGVDLDVAAGLVVY